MESCIPTPSGWNRRIAGPSRHTFARFRPAAMSMSRSLAPTNVPRWRERNEDHGNLRPESALAAKFMNERLQAKLNRAQIIALVLGIIALVLTGFGAFLNPRQGCFSYLFGCLFWLG